MAAAAANIGADPGEHPRRISGQHRERAASRRSFSQTAFIRCANKQPRSRMARGPERGGRAAVHRRDDHSATHRSRVPLRLRPLWGPLLHAEPVSDDHRANSRQCHSVPERRDDRSYL